MTEKYIPINYDLAPHSHTVKLHRCLSIICDYNAVEAIMLNAIDEEALKHDTGDGWITISLPKLSYLMAHAASRNTIKKAIRSLEAKGFIQHITGNGNTHSSKFKLNYSTINEAIRNIDISKTPFAQQRIPDYELPDIFSDINQEPSADQPQLKNQEETHPDIKTPASSQQGWVIEFTDTGVLRIMPPSGSGNS